MRILKIQQFQYIKKTGWKLNCFVNEFKTKTQLTNITELVHNIRIKTVDYSFKVPHAYLEEGIDKKIIDMEYDYVEDTLKLNDDIKG